MPGTLAGDAARAILTTMADAVMVLDADLVVTFVNERAASLIDAAADLPGRRLGEIGELASLHLEDAARAARAMGGQVEQEAARGAPERWLACTLHPAADGATVIFMRDVTPLHLAEQAQRESERRLRRAQAVGRIGSWELDLRTRTMWASDEAFHIYGLAPTPGGRVPLEVAQQFPVVEDRARLDEALARLIAGTGTYDVEFRVQRAEDGRVIVVHSLAEVARDAAERPVWVFGTLQDVTERAQADEELRRLASAIAQTSDIVILQAADGAVRYVNPAFTSVYGYEGHETLGRQLDFLSSGRHDAAFWRDRRRRAEDHGTWSGAITNRRRDGSLVEVESTLSAVRRADGTIGGFVQVGRDVTAARAREARLAEAQRLEAVGHLAGGIAHDFNNLLTAIRGYAELLRDELEVDRGTRDDLTEIVRCADRASDLVRQLLAFSGQQVLDPVVVEPGAIIREITPMLRRLIGEHIEVAIEDAAEGATIVVDPGQLEQVVINLAVNARDAMPHGGRLTIETSLLDVADEADAPAPAPGAPARPRGWVRLAIADTGSGMDAATRARIFEPFFTTKETGKGTGMGLATVRGIVNQSGGLISVASEPGRGTRFTLLFPRATGGPTGRRGAPPVGSAAGSERILLVEDDELVRTFAVRALERRGYRVTPAGDAREALGLLGGEQAFDLVVTDIVMPGLSGPALGALLRAGDADLRILYVSGFSDDILADHSAPDVVRHFLAKPYTGDDLARAVRSVLERPAS